MTTPREDVLSRVRDALALAPSDPSPVPRDYRTGRTMPDDERVDLLIERILDYKAGARRCGRDELAATIAQTLRSRGVRRLGVPAGLDEGWLAEFDGDIVEDTPDTGTDRLEQLDGVLTASAVTCAETGTIFLDGSPAQGRRALTLVPDLHVCVVDAADVVVGVPEAIARLHPTRPTTLISGPSATSDIELERVEGVHGPRTLEVVIVS